MNIIVTGGAGFIGSNLVNELRVQGHDVLVVDNFHTGAVSNLPKTKNRLFTANAGQIAEASSMHEFIPEVIFHEGIYSSSPMYREHPTLYYEVMRDFQQILEFARKPNIYAKVIFASSSSIYNGLPTPHTETQMPKIKDYYTEARIAMERLGQLYSEFYGIPVIGLRYFSVYGKNDYKKGRYANLVTQFFESIMCNKSPIIYGDGKQSRDFTEVRDVVRANIAAMKSDIQFGVFNVGTGKSTSLNEVVAILNTKLDRQCIPRYEPNRIKNYVDKTLADTEFAKKRLGFKANISLEKGIESLINDVR